ncbi:MAG: hypothetical protein A2655_02575 [Candidatus Yanofskybacteria bacterium RIFCSPHIGHO2_01_FULL_43_42]|nr:MAG: hypothetical protein A2655_02575 [Candidatus Yanofskybacteria bacterium RIFCSPHIGHO2_01_FULL_43_42]
MDTKLKIGIIAFIIVLVIGGGVYFFWQSQHQKYLKLSGFATCVKSSGAIFYGAFWCSHCQNQKSLFTTFFESAEKDLPYVECSTTDGKGQLQVCKDQGIKGYPTWKFADGSVQEGEMSLQDLSDKTKCLAPN